MPVCMFIQGSGKLIHNGAFAGEGKGNLDSAEKLLKRKYLMTWMKMKNKQMSNLFQ